MYTLYFYHDPMCSWCWAYRPVSDTLFAMLPDTIQLEYIVGGLAADSDEVMDDRMKHRIAGYWQTIHDQLGTQFNFDFWTICQPRRSTYPACRAVLAAGEQDQHIAMIDAIQRAYYLQARNPSDVSTHIELAEEIGLDQQLFKEAIISDRIESRLQQHLRFTRVSPIHGFPSLCLEVNGALLPVIQDYKSYQITLDDIARKAKLTSCIRNELEDPNTPD